MKNIIALTCVAIVVIYAAARSLWIGKRYRNASDWPITEATIQSGQIEQYGKGTFFPCFAFSYIVAGEYYSGRFFLGVPRDDAKAKIKGMIDRKFEVHYNPKDVTDRYIPVSVIDGYNVDRV
jgi:hypothetical protein